MSQTLSRRASFPWQDGRPPHLPVGPGEVTATALLPGDPDRVMVAASMLDDVRDFGQRREFRVATGRCGAALVTICSTGIGGPSAGIALVELAGLGIRHAIRIGGMGAITDDLPLGGFLIVEAATGGTGTAALYGARDKVPANGTVVAALVAAAETLSLRFKVGVVATTDSYYLGQGRALSAEASGGGTEAGFLQKLRDRGVDGMDMETETVLAVGRRLGLAAGAVLAVHGHRNRDTWLEDYEPTQRMLVRMAAMAAALLQAGEK